MDWGYGDAKYSFLLCTYAALTVQSAVETRVQCTAFGFIPIKFTIFYCEPNLLYIFAAKTKYHRYVPSKASFAVAELS